MSIHINCSIIAGPAKGGKAWLSTGQQITIGRTEAADFCFPNDAELSSIHFSLSAEGTQCILRDLQSTNGTFVGGQRVSDAALNDGDQFRAGRCVFAVEVLESAAQKSHRASVIASSQTASKDVHHVPPDATLRPGQHAEGGHLSQQADFLLHIRPHGGSVETIELADGQSLVIGRTGAAQHVIPTDPDLSSLHFEIAVDNGACVVRDLSSSKGTFVNETRIAKQNVNVGQVIRAGRTSFRLANAAGQQRSKIDTRQPCDVRPAREAQGRDDQNRERSIAGATDFESVKTMAASSSVETTPPPAQDDSDPPEGGNVQLKYQIRDNPPQVLWLREGQSVVIGSSEEADHLVRGDQGLAARHFELISEAGACVIRDLGSPSGTLVNGESTVGQVLSSGDRIVASDTRFEVTIHATPQLQNDS